METILATRGLTKHFSGKAAVDNVSIEVNKGDIYGFIGENGAGKTTLMRMVCGLAAPTSGEIKLFGSNDLSAKRRKVGCTIENPAIYPQMTALGNMEVQRLLLGVKDRSSCKELLKMAGVGDTGKKKVGHFSLGMKQRLMIALSLLGDPEFLVLDEPTNGLDPMGIKEVRDIIQYLNRERGITVFVSSHILGELEKMATRYGVISHGKMVAEFQANEIMNLCGENLLITTDNPQKTQEIISGMFSDAEAEITPENTIRIRGHVEDAGQISKKLIEAGIVVNGITPEGDSLENYFLKLMGGTTHA
jgi:ABC-2 type transport system ATP-binding protein